MNSLRQPAAATTAKITALYERLSREDILTGESLSIQNQRDILENYAAQNGFTNLRHFSDDGITGVRFDREGWQQLMAEVEAGNVSTIITKDLSRFAREHVQAEVYLELFRQKGIRFIAVTNGVDSINPDTLEYVPFLNIFSEWYARDTSKKIKAVAHAKGNAGKPLSYNAIYGYKKSPGDKNLWLVDEEAAAVVRRVFQMALEGMGPYQIAKRLSEEKVEKPSCYFVRHKMTGPRPSSRDLSEPYAWNGGTIKAMLAKPEYCGHTVNFRTRKESYKDKNYKWNPKEDWKIFHNTHDAIIEQATFNTVQKLRGTPRRVDTVGEANPLTGLVFCADCGAKMYNSRQSKDYYMEKRGDKVYKHKTADFYTCSTYDLGKNKFQTVCSSHFIRTAVIREIVLDAIRKICGYVRKNEAEFVGRIREVSAVRQAEAAKAHKRQLAKNERRIAELDVLFRKVYEDNASGKLSDEWFAQLSGAYDSEQRDLREQSARLQSELDVFEADSEKAEKFIGVVRRYTEFETLSNAMLSEFVQKIVVHSPDKSSGERVQKVDVYLNFIGDFAVPAEDEAPPTPEELEAREKRRKRLERQREANRRFYAKQKAKREQQEQEQISA